MGSVTVRHRGGRDGRRWCRLGGGRAGWLVRVPLVGSKEHLLLCLELLLLDFLRRTCVVKAAESATSAAPHGRTAASLPHEAPARVECAAQPAAWRLGPRRPGQRAVAPPRRALSTAWWTMRQLACNQSSPRSVPAHTAAICGSSSPVPWWRSTWCRLVLHSSRSSQALPVGVEWDTLILQAALCGEAGRAGR